MISTNNPFDKEIDIEDNIAVKCDNCGHFTVLKYYYEKDLNIERETAKFYYEIKDEYKKAKYQLENVPFIYKKYRRHPREILITLSYFKMDWVTDSINKKALDRLIGKCHNCNKVLEHERLDKIKEIKEIK